MIHNLGERKAVGAEGEGTSLLREKKLSCPTRAACALKPSGGLVFQDLLYEIDVRSSTCEMHSQ